MGLTVCKPCPAGFVCPFSGMSAAELCANAPVGSQVCETDLASLFVYVAVGMSVITVAVVWLYRRWQEHRLRTLAQHMFDNLAQCGDELIQRRALVRGKVVDLSARIPASDLRQIGAGAFGSVYRGRLVELNAATGVILGVADVVVKKPLRVTVDAQLENMQEISLLMGLPRHPHVLCLLGAYTDAENVLCAVTPFMMGGSLEAQMEAHLRDRMQAAWLAQPMQVAIVVHDMFSGLLHLHIHSIMHRDRTSTKITQSCSTKNFTIIIEWSRTRYCGCILQWLRATFYLMSAINLCWQTLVSLAVCSQVQIMATGNSISERKVWVFRFDGMNTFVRMIDKSVWWLLLQLPTEYTLFCLCLWQ
jgi:hypothetical protein